MKHRLTSNQHILISGQCVPLKVPTSAEKNGFFRSIYMCIVYSTVYILIGDIQLFSSTSLSKLVSINRRSDICMVAKEALSGKKEHEANTRSDLIYYEICASAGG